MAGPNMDQFDAYFRRADLDLDGRITGGEAVSFFQGSGLSKQVLAQIWTYADQKRAGFLNRQEFYNALKLVTVAQSKRELTPDIVKAALYGPASSKIPAPQINLPSTPMPQSTPLSASPSTQIGLRVATPSQNLGFRGPMTTNANMSHQTFPSPGNQLMRPPQVMPVESSHATQGFQGPPNSGISTDWLNGRTIGAPLRPTSQVSSQGISLSASSGVSEHSPVTYSDSSAPVSSAPVPLNIAPQSSPQVSLVQSSFDSLQNGFMKHPVGGQSKQLQTSLGVTQPVSPDNSSIVSGAGNLASNQSQTSWSKMTTAGIQKYTKVFKEVDTDRDGKITGEQARDLFLSWRLPRVRTEEEPAVLYCCHLHGITRNLSVRG